MKEVNDKKTGDLLSRTFRGAYAKSAKGQASRTFGEFVASCRIARKMTQVEYAASLSMSRRSLITMEKMEARPRWSHGFPRTFAEREFKSWFNMVDAADKWMAGGK